MIKANELRIGNRAIFCHPEKSYNCEIKAQDIVDCATGERTFAPIPLTPEILESLGFRKVLDNEENDCYELKLSNGIAYYGLYVYEKSVGLFHKGSLIGTSNLYVHQLQNLYSALTGKELSIKE